MEAGKKPVRPRRDLTERWNKIPKRKTGRGSQSNLAHTCMETTERNGQRQQVCRGDG